MIIELKDGKTLDGLWQLVPVEPTENMRVECRVMDYQDDIKGEWMRLLAAAPQYAPDLERCTHKLRAAGKPYSRTCEVCGPVGPCHVTPESLHGQVGRWGRPMTSADRYEKMSPEQKHRLDSDLDELGKRIQEHNRSHDRRTHNEVVPFDRRHGDRRHNMRNEED